MEINEFNDDYFNELLDKKNTFISLPSCPYTRAHKNSNSKTLKDKNFSNMGLANISSGKLTATLSDYLSHFLVAQSSFLNSSATR